jgi:ribosomal protein S18 acetylase RimI-like enzyme
MAVRHAVAADLPALAATLGRAFADDQLFTWVYEGSAGDALERRLTSFFDVCLRAGLRRGHTYAVDGDVGAAIWSPPDVDVFDDEHLEELVLLLAGHLGARAELVGEAFTLLGEAHPHDVPHFYLFVLGTRPDHRGAGVGSALLRHVLDTCDAEGLPAYLESSDPRNVPLYERHGFRVLQELEVSPGGPTARPMWRDPA